MSLSDHHKASNYMSVISDGDLQADEYVAAQSMLTSAFFKGEIDIDIRGKSHLAITDVLQLINHFTLKVKRDIEP